MRISAALLMYFTLMLTLGPVIAAEESSAPTEAAPQQGEVVDAPAAPPPVVLARVGADEITVQDLLSYATTNASLLDALTKDETKSKVLGAMVVSRLILKAAQNEGLLKPEFTDIELQMAVAELKRRHFAVTDEPTEQEVQAFYEDNKARYSTPPYVRLRQILFKVARDADEAVRAEAHGKAETALQRINDGAPFEVVAADMTEEETRKATSGDVGFVPLQQGQWYYDAVASLGEGEHTDIMDTDTGFQILQVIGRKDAVATPFERVKPRVLADFQVSKEIALRDAYIRQLAQEIPVTIERESFAAAHPLMPGFSFVGSGF